jgi:hypothetical protein
MVYALPMTTRHNREASTMTEGTTYRITCSDGDVLVGTLVDARIKTTRGYVAVFVLTTGSKLALRPTEIAKTEVVR